MIEDKITEKPQRKQRERYETRAKELEEQKLFEKHYVFLCAPQAYLESDYAQGYERKVPYESIVDLLDEGLDKAVLAKGIEGGKNSFIKNESVTNY